MNNKPLIYRKNMKFCIDETQLKPQFRKIDVINGLYAAMYEEFKGAIHNDKYSNLTSQEKMQKINKFAEDWLKIRGFM